MIVIGVFFCFLGGLWLQRISNTHGLVTGQPLTDFSISCRFRSFVTKYNAGDLEVGVEGIDEEALFK